MKPTIFPATATARLLSPAYVRELRQLLREDAYDTIHVVDEIARRIRTRGDL